MELFLPFAERNIFIFPCWFLSEFITAGNIFLFPGVLSKWKISMLNRPRPNHIPRAARRRGPAQLGRQARRRRPEPAWSRAALCTGGAHCRPEPSPRNLLGLHWSWCSSRFVLHLFHCLKMLFLDQLCFFLLVWLCSFGCWWLQKEGKVVCYRTKGCEAVVSSHAVAWLLRRLVGLVGISTWLWLKKPVPKWNPGKWKYGPKPA